MLKQEEINYEERDRRPRALRYEDHARAIEQQIMDGLPEIIDKLMSMAKEGNVPAAKYLIDRIHGRPAKLSTAAVGDTSLPYDHQDWASDQVRWMAIREDKSQTALRRLGHDLSLTLGPRMPGIGDPRSR